VSISKVRPRYARNQTLPREEMLKPKRPQNCEIAKGRREKVNERERGGKVNARKIVRIKSEQKKSHRIIQLIPETR
jgi:hypothetical protein